VQQRLEIMQHSARRFSLDAPTRVEICRGLRRQLAVMVGLVVLQMSSGQLAIMYHMHTVLRFIGFGEDCGTTGASSVDNADSEALAARATVPARTAVVVGWASYPSYGLLFLAAPLVVYLYVLAV
jgi:hypothetical protein